MSRSLTILSAVGVIALMVSLAKPQGLSDDKSSSGFTRLVTNNYSLTVPRVPEHIRYFPHAGLRSSNHSEGAAWVSRR
jgi:hypothetical protein